LILSKDLTKVILTVQFLAPVGRFVLPFMLQLGLDGLAVMILAEPALNVWRHVRLVLKLKQGTETAVRDGLYGKMGAVGLAENTVRDM
jgi:hypothetical protein